MQNDTIHGLNLKEGYSAVPWLNHVLIQGNQVLDAGNDTFADSAYLL